MTYEEVKGTVLRIVSEKADIPIEKLTLDSLLLQDLSLDSLDIMNLMLELEENFQLTIPDEETEKIKTIGDAIDYIAKHLA